MITNFVILNTNLLLITLVVFIIFFFVSAIVTRNHKKELDKALEELFYAIVASTKDLSNKVDQAQTSINRNINRTEKKVAPKKTNVLKNDNKPARKAKK